jgi:hypothetical protein
MRPNGKRLTEEPLAELAHPMPLHRGSTIEGHEARQCSPD